MIDIKTKTTSLFALTLAALIVTGCNPEDPKPDPDPDPEVEHNWELVFADEFDGTVIDDSKWAFEVNCWGGGNNEEQCYVDNPDNAFVEDGHLHIKAIRGDYTGAIYNQDDARYNPAETNTKAFTSARMRTVGPNPYVEGEDPSFSIKNDWKYGRFEIRAKLPEGQGTWPAIWMLPSDWEFGGWAMSGEIDIMEVVNLKADRDLSEEDNGETGIVPENRVHGTLHYGRAWPGNVYSGAAYDFGDTSINPADDFHTYAIEWEEGAIRWFIDGNHFATQTQEGWYTHYQDENGDWQTGGTTAAPFDQNFHLIMNVAIGGAWAANVNEGGVDDSITEAEMIVDYVRVYQCEDDATGVACGSRGEEGTYELVHGVVEPDLPVAADFSADPLVIFNGNLAADWQLAKWDDADGGDEYEVVDGYIDLQFDNTGVMYLYSDQGKLDDFTTYAGDYTFNMRWVAGTATGLKVGINDEAGNFAYVTVDQGSFGSVGATDWTAVTIPVADMLTNAPGFDLTTVNIAGKFEQVGGTDLHVQIKDINMTKGDYVPPVDEDLGYHVDILSDVLAEGYAIQNFWDGGDGGETINVTDGTVSVSFSGVGNMGINSTSLMDLTDFAEGKLLIDLKVTSLGSATDLVVKLDSGWPAIAPVNLTNYISGGVLAVDTDFVSYEIPMSDLIAAGEGGFAIDSVTNPLVLEPVGGNLAFEFKNVSIVRDIDILGSALSSGFSIQNFWDGGDGGETISVDTGTVSVAFTGIGNMGINSDSAIDLSGFTGGHLTFDLKVTDLGSATDLAVKLDSGWPAIAPVNLTSYRTGNTFAVDADFESYQIPISDFVANGEGGFAIDAVLNPLVLEPVGSNLQFEFKNVQIAH